MSTQSTNDEVDLGALFKVVGKGIQNFFNTIGQFFKAIYHYLILFLLFLRNNALKLGITTLLGAGIGLYLDITNPKVYSSTMVVQPNFNSTQQLYNSIDFLHELVRQKDSLRLSETLGIPIKETSKLKGFYVEPVKNENERYEVFNEFLQRADTAISNNISFKDFKKGFTNLDYKHHEIKVKSENSIVFEKLGAPIINTVENNPYYEKQKRINDQNLLQNEQVLLKSLKEIDTLRKIYNEVLITEAKKQETGTSITLAQGVKKTEEVELFNESLKLNEELIANNKEKAESTEILNVVSTFGKVGMKERAIHKKKTFQIGVLFFGLMLLLILANHLNKYLVNYR